MSRTQRARDFARRSARPLRRRFGLWIPLGIGLAMLVLARVVAIAQGTPRRSSFEAHVWNFGETPAGPMTAVVLVPRGLAPGERLPLLVALHGHGEAIRGPTRGAWGWERDYELGASDRALRSGSLTRSAFLDLVDPARLRALHDDLQRRPYRGVIVVAPYTPDAISDGGDAVSEAFASWVVGALVPRARAELPVLTTREATGIDGVSLGGWRALTIGFAHPETFGVVGALQAAVRGVQSAVADRYVASPARPTQRIRLVTSDGDPLRPDVTALSEMLRARGIAHELRTLVGPHDYDFNRGPGGIEMLLFHDRALRGDRAL